MYYYFNGLKVDVFGYDKNTNQYHYAVETPYFCRPRKAKAHYKHPDKRNEWRFPFGAYIYIIDAHGKKHRLYLN